MKKLLLILICATMAQITSAQTHFENYFSDFELLKTDDGKAITIEGSYCKPSFFDFNGDGIDDLVTGEFGRVSCKSPIPNYKKGFVEGRGRIFLNSAVKGGKFSGFTWLIDNDTKRPLYVPITCCTLLSPFFADINGDGYVDLFSGSYKGELHVWYGNKNREFGSEEIIKDIDGKEIIIGNATAVAPVDIDGDGDFDLVINGLYDGLFLIKNVGEPTKALFENKKTEIKSNNERLNYSVAAEIIDWDIDGVLDLIYSDRDGNVLFSKGVDGKFIKPEYLIKGKREDTQLVDGQLPIYSGGNVNFSIYDYNKDGKKDIVIGASSSVKFNRDLTPEQVIEGEKCNQEFQLISEKWGKLCQRAIKKYKVDNFYVGSVPYEKLPTKLAEEFKLIDDEYIRLDSKRRELDSTYTDTRAFIWVYYRK